jgi:hypothetical protein
MLTRSDASALIDKTLKDKKARRLERQAEVLDLDV